VAKTTVVCVEFLPDVTCQKLLKLSNVSGSYSKNKSATFFIDHCVLYLRILRFAFVDFPQTFVSVEDWRKQMVCRRFAIKRSKIRVLVC